MPADMKRTIAEAAQQLIQQNKGKRKLTVKAIVDCCHITRQTYYYHFQDVPDLIRWTMEQEVEKAVQECLREPDQKEGLKCFFTLALRARPMFEMARSSNYEQEIFRMMIEGVQIFLQKVMAETGYAARMKSADLQMMVRYHAYAIAGVLIEWNPKDDARMDEIVQQILRLVAGKMLPTERETE